jgi:alkanesulfonate monooxygenase SsuD/methylene tetrahydromethanopterin reductase-like flavin-dependent oxidoreductase (luciferase family)
VDSVVAGLLIVGLTVAVDEDRDQAKALARQFMSTTVTRLGSPYARNLLRYGYFHDELAQGADRAVDDILGYGNSDAIATKVQQHLAAGADHVRLSVIVPEFTTGIDQLETLGLSDLRSI